MTVIPNFGTNDVYVAYLPLAHVFELAVETVMMTGDASVVYSLALTLTDASNKIKKGTQGDALVLKPALMTEGFYFSNLHKVFKVIGNSVALNSSYGSTEEVACDSDSVSSGSGSSHHVDRNKVLFVSYKAYTDTQYG
nr:long chain acyl-CoA synthetase 8 [Ipomoea trifida]GMC48794.1 long-chain acyl-CoA synthetase 8 [Ipomoea batatas]